MKLALILLLFLVNCQCDPGPSDYHLLDPLRSHTKYFQLGNNYGDLMIAIKNALAGSFFPATEDLPSQIFDEMTLNALQDFQQQWKVNNEKGGVGAKTMKAFDDAMGIRACSTPGISRLSQGKVTPGITSGAVKVLDTFAGYPIGTEIPFNADGDTFIARVELHFHAWNGTVSPRGYHRGISVYYFDPDPLLTGSEFMTRTNDLSVEQREAMILIQLARKNVPSLQFFNVSHDYQGNLIEYQVLADYLSIGTDKDFIRIPMAAFTAQKILDILNSTAPTTLMVDQIWKATDVKIEPQPIPPGPEMTSNAYFIRENDLINSQIKGMPFGVFLGGQKKDLVITNKFEEHPDSVAIYGWHQLNGKPIQPLYLGHAAWYADYSHGVRVVQKTAWLNGVQIQLDTLLKHPNYSSLISREGVMNDPRIPIIPIVAPDCIPKDY